MTTTSATSSTLHFISMLTIRRSVTQSLLLCIIMNGRVRGGIVLGMFMMRMIWCGGGGGSHNANRNNEDTHDYHS
jgi:hypothetical protein